MIEPGWRRISGVHCQDSGEISVVWIAHEKEADRLHLYDAHIFRREVLAVVADGIRARGHWIPIAWESGSKELIEKLLDRRCNTLPEAIKTDTVLAEAASREVWERMRTGRFKVARGLDDWLKEFESFSRRDGKVPLEGFPLMAATRYAVEMLDWSLSHANKYKHSLVYPKVAIV